MINMTAADTSSNDVPVGCGAWSVTALCGSSASFVVLDGADRPRHTLRRRRRSPWGKASSLPLGVAPAHGLPARGIRERFF
jgi:hypothetical protein